MTTNTTDFLQEHAPDGVLNPEQATRYLELVEGDTGADALDGGEPSANPDPAAAPGDVQGTNNVNEGAAAPAPAPAAAGAVAAPAPDEASLNADNAVILAKDGKHTIGYDKLVEARQGEQQWRARAEAATAELEVLRGQAQQRADAGQAQTQTDANVAAADKAIEAGVDPAVFGDFSEEALARGIAALTAKGLEPLLGTVQALQQQVQALRGELAPLRQTHARDAQQAHYSAIYQAHPDADSLAQSRELQGWIDQQPTFARAGYRAVLQDGSAAEVVELFTTFKQATGQVQAAPAPPPAVDARAAARAAIANAPAQVPFSLSDIPGGAAGPGSRFEAMAAMSGPQLAETMESMTPEQREAFLNRST